MLDSINALSQIGQFLFWVTVDCVLIMTAVMASVFLSVIARSLIWTD